MIYNYDRPRQNKTANGILKTLICNYIKSIEKIKRKTKDISFGGEKENGSKEEKEAKKIAKSKISKNHSHVRNLHLSVIISSKGYMTKKIVKIDNSRKTERLIHLHPPNNITKAYADNVSVSAKKNVRSYHHVFKEF